MPLPAVNPYNKDEIEYQEPGFDYAPKYPAATITTKVESLMRSPAFLIRNVMRLYLPARLRVRRICRPFSPMSIHLNVPAA